MEHDREMENLTEQTNLFDDLTPDETNSPSQKPVDGTDLSQTIKDTNEPNNAAEKAVSEGHWDEESARTENEKALYRLLRKINESSLTERDKGTRFETLIKDFLTREPSYRDLFAKVQTYKEWAAEHKDIAHNGKDIGIDLVGTKADDCTFAAIQCKFYKPDTTVSKKDIDSFIAASNTDYFTARYFVATNDKWGNNAENQLTSCIPHVQVIKLEDLASSRIDWNAYMKGEKAEIPRRKPRPYQQEAIDAVVKGFETSSRGKLIMACGTGKTYTALKIAEQPSLAGKGRLVLFLVPSLSLLSQTLTDWKQQCEFDINAFAVCSDSKIGKANSEDIDEITSFDDLKYPATTDAYRLAEKVKKALEDKEKLTVIFSTYQSIEVISGAQKSYGLPDIDLIICDEAHRTAGGYFTGEEENIFTRVHNQDFIRANKRLYMTATPKIFGSLPKSQALNNEVVLYSMDDEATYGPTFYTLSFADAVSLDCLVDYKVVVFAAGEEILNFFDAPIGGFEVTDAAKVIGTWRALAKCGLRDTSGKKYDAADAEPMKRAVAFAQVINPTEGRVSSKAYAGSFAEVVENFIETKCREAGIDEKGAEEERANALQCETRHIDGSMNAIEKSKLLHWLKEEPEENHCKILFNVRCLSEGVDVPALDAVVFLSPRKSEVDVVQTVGRVMRKAPGKKRGYVVIPIVTPDAADPSLALDNNKSYDVVWQILRALKSIDSRFEDGNYVDGQLGKVNSDKIEVICVSNAKIERHSKGEETEDRRRGRGSGGSGYREHEGQSVLDDFRFDRNEVAEAAIRAKIVKRVGNRHSWAEWAENVAGICQQQREHIEMSIERDKTGDAKAALDEFEKELRATLNDSISHDEIIEMLAQHIVIKPVMDALFNTTGYHFSEKNPIAAAMTATMDKLDKGSMRHAELSLQTFYSTVKDRVKAIQTPQERQTLILELFNNFFKAAFPKMQDKLGIVYTPVEIVDFINQSVADILQSEFHVKLSDPSVQILDPFTGTGTFITRMMTSGLIEKDRLPYKYKNDLHANEIVPLAYYIASVNIESVYHDIFPDSEYEPNNVMVWTDTFKPRKREKNIFTSQLKQNDKRRENEDNLDIRVIVGNPPYSVGQSSQNDDNQNEHYEELDRRIAETYTARSTATNNKALHDSYIKAYRWAADRIKSSPNGGVIGFVTNAGWLDSNSADGMRKCMCEEFNTIYIYNLKGKQIGTIGDESSREGGKIFDQMSRAQVAIVMLIRNPNDTDFGKIYFREVDDYLTREQKLDEVKRSESVHKVEWRKITPDSHGDWLSQREEDFSHFMSVDGKTSNDKDGIFVNYSLGIATSRDAWAYNSSNCTVEDDMKRCIAFYNEQVERKKASTEYALDMDPQKLKWNANLVSNATTGIKSPSFSMDKVFESLYRPFYKQVLYYDKFWNARTYQMPKLFPNKDSENLVVVVTGIGASIFSCLMVKDAVPDLQLMFNAQCLPRYLYTQDRMFGTQKIDAISDAAIKHFAEAYGREISADDIFYYVYGILHSEEYRARYANNLMKELPRIPRVATYEQFEAFRDAGRALGELHVNYENAEPYGGVTITGLDSGNFRVTQMKYGKIPGKTGNAAKDKTKIIYNSAITITDIPLEAQEYVVNKKSALDWIVERACVKTDKETGIVNDFNQWGIEHGNPRYQLDLVLKVITVSLKTMEIVKSLPPLEIHKLDAGNAQEEIGESAEDEHDLKEYEKASAEFRENPITYSHDEVKKILELE